MAHTTGLRIAMAGALVCLAAGTLVAAPMSLVEYRFNETGTTAASSGSNTTAANLLNGSGIATDLHTADLLGVSGLAGDRAFNNTTAGGKAQHAADLAAVDGLTSFTLQGWFKGSTLPTNSQIIANFTAAGSGFVLRANGSDATNWWMNVEGVEVSSTGGAYAGTPDAWKFFAVTYDGTQTANNVNFYVGSTFTAVSLVNTASLNQGAIADDAAALTLGNRVIGSDRTATALFDNLRVYGSTSDGSGVLSLTELETIRGADAAVPEPALLGLAGLSMLLGLRRRQA